MNETEAIEILRYLYNINLNLITKTTTPAQLGKIENNVEALDLAMQALQEKAERENPKPLTLEQLKERVGKPVNVKHLDKDFKYLDGWGIVKEYEEWSDLLRIGEEYFKGSMCGKSYNLYNHEPKEATDE